MFITFEVVYNDMQASISWNCRIFMPYMKSKQMLMSFWVNIYGYNVHKILSLGNKTCRQNNLKGRTMLF